MDINITNEDVLKFIRDYGLKPYESCPCGSGEKYKHCCKAKSNIIKSETNINKIYHKMKSNAWNRNNWPVTTCHWHGCTEVTQKCHSIQNNRYLNKIYNNDKKVYHLLPTGNLEKEQYELQYEIVSLASTFLGFCNNHDRILFKEIEGKNDIVFSKSQLYSFVYRNVYYIYCKKEVMDQTITQTHLRACPKYYTNKFKPANNYEAKLSVDGIINLRKKEVVKEELKEIISQIESNFDTVQENWKITNDVLVFSSVRKLKIEHPYFCFQTIREYISKEEIEIACKNAKLHDFNNKIYSFISTIILPDPDNSQIDIFFAISSQCRSDKTIAFIDKVNSCSDDELRICLNNIILYAHEELYMSKEKYYDRFTKKEQEELNKMLYEITYKDSTLYLEDIFINSSFNFLK